MPPDPSPDARLDGAPRAALAALAVLDVLPPFGAAGLTAADVGALVDVSEGHAAWLLDRLTRRRLVAASRATRTAPARFTVTDTNPPTRRSTTHG